jgi:hypothetical protein
MDGLYNPCERELGDLSGGGQWRLVVVMDSQGTAIDTTDRRPTCQKTS